MVVVHVLDHVPIRLGQRGERPSKGTPLPLAQFLLGKRKLRNQQRLVFHFAELSEPEVAPPCRLMKSVFPRHQRLVVVVVSGQVHGKRFEAPPGRHDIAKPGHSIHLGEGRVEPLKPDNGPAKNDLGNHQKRDDDVDDFRRVEQRRNQQPKHVAEKSHGKQHNGVGEHESPNVQDGMRDQHKAQAVHHRHGGHHSQLGVDEVVPFDLQKLLSLKQRPVPENFLCTHAQPQEQRHNDGNEQERRHIFTGPEGVVGVGQGKPHEPCKQHGKRRRLQQVDPEVLLVAPFGEDVTRQERCPLRPTGGGLGGWRDHRGLCFRSVGFLLKQHRVEVAPLLRRCTSYVGFAAVFVHGACFEDVEDLLGVDVAAGRALALVVVDPRRQFVEVAHGVQRVAPVHRMPPHIKHEQAVEHLEQIR